MIHSQHYDQLYKQLNDAYREIKRLSNENLALKIEIEKTEKTSWELSTELYKTREELKKEWEKVYQTLPNTAPPAAQS